MDSKLPEDTGTHKESREDRGEGSTGVCEIHTFHARRFAHKLNRLDAMGKQPGHNDPVHREGS